MAGRSRTKTHLVNSHHVHAVEKFKLVINAELEVYEIDDIVFPSCQQKKNRMESVDTLQNTRKVDVECMEVMEKRTQEEQKVVEDIKLEPV